MLKCVHEQSSHGSNGPVVEDGEAPRAEPTETTTEAHRQQAKVEDREEWRVGHGAGHGQRRISRAKDLAIFRRSGSHSSSSGWRSEAVPCERRSCAGSQEAIDNGERPEEFAQGPQCVDSQRSGGAWVFGQRLLPELEREAAGHILRILVHWRQHLHHAGPCGAMMLLL